MLKGLPRMWKEDRFIDNINIFHDKTALLNEVKIQKKYAKFYLCADRKQ